MELARSVRTHFARAPLTTAWLLVLLITTIVQHAVSAATVSRWLAESSTDLVHLSREPLSVLASSLVWLDGAYWLPYALFFGVLLVPTEHWLGARRWLMVGVAGHVLATYISQGALWLAIYAGFAGPSEVSMRDVGVSYFMFAIMGVLAYRFTGRWRAVYVAVIVTCCLTPLIVDVGVTNLGHFSAVLIGLACYPLTRGVGSSANSPAHRETLLTIPRQLSARRFFSCSTSKSGSGHPRSMASKASMTSSVIASRAYHLRSAGTTCQGATSVSVSSSIA